MTPSQFDIAKARWELLVVRKSFISIMQALLSCQSRVVRSLLQYIQLEVGMGGYEAANQKRLKG